MIDITEIPATTNKQSEKEYKPKVGDLLARVQFHWKWSFDKPSYGIITEEHKASYTVYWLDRGLIVSPFQNYDIKEIEKFKRYLNDWINYKGADFKKWKLKSEI